MKLAVNFALAIIVILLFSLLVQKKPADDTSTPETGQIDSQTIVDDTDDAGEISKN